MAEMPAFTLRTPRHTLYCNGGATLPPGDIHSLSQRIARFFAEHPGGSDLLVGALPYDRQRPAHLFHPSDVVRLSSERSNRMIRFEQPGYRWAVLGGGEPAAYAAAVARAVKAIERSAATADPLYKVVLARHLDLVADRAIDVDSVVRDLARDERVAAFAVQLPPADLTSAGFAGGRSGPIAAAPSPQAAPPRWLVGATPELLVSKTGTAVKSMPLAGSARRSPFASQDREAARALMASDKDHREHQAVVDAVLDALSPYCSRLSTGSGPELMSTASMWHLGTRVEGTLKDPGTPSAELAAALHPTPAVCGLPREQARETIAALEPFDRGYYAGAVGWCDRAGDGAWYVTIRCAEIAGAAVRLYAGAGVVAGSDPVRETRETAAKFAAMLNVLGVDEAMIGSLLDRSPQEG